jgi:hypothetical protein
VPHYVHLLPLTETLGYASLGANFHKLDFLDVFLFELCMLLVSLDCSDSFEVANPGAYTGVWLGVNCPPIHSPNTR